MTIDLLLSPKFVVLEDVIVQGKASPIRMIKDTLEFDADFFKTQTNAVLEDLLRKLPGVEVRQGNEVYVNGQRVNKILVDGKEFFSSDPVVILKNLPTEIIAKIQVADEKNTIAKETRQQKDIPKTINIKLKKEVKKGMFGKFFAGQGTDKRYEAGGILNVFRDTLQVSLVGSSNNQGRGGFSMDDLRDLGGFGRSEGLGGQNSWELSNRYSQGIETNTLAGANVNYNIGKTWQLNGQYFYNGAKRLTTFESASQQFLGDSSLLSNGTSTDNEKNFKHKASIGLKWKQDSTGYLTVLVSGEFNNNTEQGTWDGKTYSKTVPLLSGSYTDRSSFDKHTNLSVNADYSKTFVKRHIDWSLNGSFSNDESNLVSVTNNRYIRMINNFLPDSLLQQRDNSTPNRHVKISNNFSKNWKDKHSVSWKTEYANTQKTIGGDTYQFSETTHQNELITGLSVKLKQEIDWVNNQFYYRYNYKTFAIQTGIAYRNLIIRNSYNHDSVPVLSRTYNLLTPIFNINFKGFGFSFDRYQQEPNSYYLRPVTDSSNPLYTYIGNPDLRPPVNSTYSLEYSKYFDKSNINLSIRGSVNREKDPIINTRQVFPDGKTVSGYRNLKSITNYQTDFSINKSYSKNNWNYDISLNANLYITRSPVVLNQKMINNVTTFAYPSINWFVGYKDKFRWNAGYRMNFNRSKSDDSTFRTSNTTQHTIFNSLHVQLLKRVTWDANVNYNINPGTPDGYQKQWLFCDMSITCSFLKKDRAQVKLSGFDIFNQNQGIHRYASQNYLTSYKMLVQKQYFMLTLLYTIRKF